MKSIALEPLAVSVVDGLGSPLRQIALAMLASSVLALAWWMHPMLPLAVAATLLGTVLAVSRPFVLCLLFVVFSYFRLHDAFPGLQALHIPTVLGIASVGALIFHLLLVRSIKPVWSPELKVFIVFFVFVSIGAVLAVLPEVALTFWNETYVKIGLMTLAIAWLTRRREDFAAAAQVVLISGTLIAIVAIYNKLNGIGLVGGTRVSIGRNLGSPLGDPNALAITLLFPLALAAARLVHRSGKLNTVIAALSVPLLVGAIVATQSRGGLLGIVVVVMAVGVRLVRRKWLLYGVCGVLALGLYVAMGISHRSGYGDSKSGIDESTQGRLVAWSSATKMAIKRPLTGVGIDNFLPCFDDYRADFDNADHSVHSIWFQVLAEAGFPGIAIYMVLMVFTFRSINSSLRTLVETRADPVVCALALALSAGLVGFCAAGTFLTEAFTWPFYVMFALICAIGSYAAQASRQLAVELQAEASFGIGTKR